MLDIPGFPDPNALVTTPTATVTWKGNTITASSVSLKRSLGTGLPAQVAGVDDVVAATGEVTATFSDELVAEGLHLPWIVEKPQPGDRVKITVGFDGVEVPILEGRVDNAGARVSERSVSFGVVDRVDRLRRNVSIPPLNYYHPPEVEGGALLRMGLHPTYVTDRVARVGGFHATPPVMPSNSILSAPLMGSAWPERGTLTLADIAEGSGEDPDEYPTYTSTAWGLAVRNIEAQWTPYILSQFTGRFDRPMFVRFLTGRVTSGYSRVYLKWEGEAYSQAVAVAVSPVRGVDVMVLDAPGQDVHAGLGGSRFNMPLTAAEMSAGVDVGVWLTPSGNNATVTIGVKMADGPVRTVTGSVATTSTIRNTAMQKVHLYSPTNAAAFGGLQVGFASSPYDLHQWIRSSIIETDPAGQLLSVPAIVNRGGLELLKEQANSELSAIWLDGLGRLRYRSMGRLLSSAPVVTITADNVKDLGWRTSWDSVHESVGVKYQRPVPRRANTYRVTAWEGSGISMEGTETHEEVIHPPVGEDWINVSPLRTVLESDLNSLYRYNLGRGSFIAGTIEYENAEGDQASFPATSVYISSGLTQLDHQSWVLRINSHNLPADYTMRLKVPGWLYIRESRRDENMPVIRAMAVITWDEREVQGLPLGVEGTGNYEHDCGFWVQLEPAVQAIADHIAAATSAAHPVYDQVEMATPDPRLELADMATIKLPGLTQQGLIVGIDLTVDNNGLSQTLAIQTTHTTIEEAN
ncbi:hypothetical protein [Citricoccus sp. K5]|uniref:hypothetical protein n=1 Tax=Citricoccus sp. K5 TaxID=2653135 RepID=UPI0012F2056E|nr:hypothetical protein [Citricoccus sp. K5]VXB22400.1 conserved hypothetical protein [Citricoccus sp. K5]